jgi:hypothetical protein
MKDIKSKDIPKNSPSMVSSTSRQLEPELTAKPEVEAYLIGCSSSIAE